LADTYLNYTGKLIKLIDQNDGTYAIAAELTPGAVNIGEVTLDEGHKYAGQMAVVLLKGVTTTGGVGSITDDSKDIPAGLLAGKYIKVNINGIEYVREILQNSGNAITFSGGLDEIAVPALAEYEIIDFASGTVEAPIDVQLSGSIPEYGWLSTDDEPTPLEPTKFAMGVEINTTTHEMTTKYWNGTAWVEVL